MRIILEGVVRLLHSDKAGVHCLPLLAVPRLCDQLGPKFEDQAEDAVDDVHDGSRFLCQQTPTEVRECKVKLFFFFFFLNLINMTGNFAMTLQTS